MLIWNNPNHLELGKLEGLTTGRKRDLYFFTNYMKRTRWCLFNPLLIDSILFIGNFCNTCNLHKQSLSSSIVYHPSVVLKMVAPFNTFKSGLIGDLYSTLLVAVSSKIRLQCGECWRKDVVDIDEDKWTAALEAISAVSISPYHKLTQLFILHGAYYTPHELCSWGRIDSSCCPRCSGAASTNSLNALVVP